MTQLFYDYQRSPNLKALVESGEVEILSPGRGRDTKRVLQLSRYAYKTRLEASKPAPQVVNNP